MARAIGSTAGKKARHSSSSSAGGRKGTRKRISVRQKDIGKTSLPVPASVPYEIGLDERLRKSHTYALGYLNACLEDENPAIFLLALGDVARAYGGMGNLAKKTGLNREAIYRVLSKNGNPTLSSLESLLGALGFKLKIEKK